MSELNKMVLTSVKIHENLFDDFKIECVKRNFSFQKLAERSIDLFLTNEDLRKKIMSHTNLTTSNQD